MSKVSFEDIGAVIATFAAQDSVKPGQVVKIAANGQVGFLGSQRVDGKLVLSEAVKVLAQKSA